MSLLEQFYCLVDPSTTLGAFIISLVAGMLGSFIMGFFVGKQSIKKKNNIQKIIKV